MKRSLDLNSVLFHGLEPVEAEQRTEKSLVKLESILQTGAILSRSEQLKRFNIETHKFLEKYTKETLWKNLSGNDFVSICKKQSRVKPECETDGFFFYVAGDGGISLALSQDVLKLVDSSRRVLMDGELQVKDSIPLDHMVAIVCGGKSFKELSEEIKSRKEIGLTHQLIKELLPYALVEKQVQIKDSIGELLYKYGYGNLPIISSRDGFEIGDVDDVLHELEL